MSETPHYDGRMEGISHEHERRALYRFMHHETMTIAKAGDPDKNEDQFYFADDVLVLADGATDKTGIEYPSGKSGGRELAEIATDVASSSLLTGYDLADEITAAVQAFYKTANPEALTDASKRAASTLVCARLIDDEVAITQIGDSNIRVTFTDGTRQIYTNDKRVDAENASQRSQYIHSELNRLRETSGREVTEEERRTVIKNGRDVIQDRLNTQYVFQNNADNPVYGYGTIDGMKIPRFYNDGSPTNFVKMFVLKQDDVAAIELVSDGFYGEFPETSALQDYDALYVNLHEGDPDKYINFLSTKSRDDATVLIARLG